MEQFCKERGLPAPTLVHVGSSQVWRAGNLALRLTDTGRNPATLDDQSMLTAALALRAAGCSVVKPAESQTTALHDATLTLWYWQDSTPGYTGTLSDWKALGTSLRLFHGALIPVDLGSLPKVLASRLQTRVSILTAERPSWLNPKDLVRMQEITTELLPVLEIHAAGSQTVHGDFHHGNIIWTEDGPVISDLEGLSLGTGYYDLAVMAERTRCYGLPADRLDALCQGYSEDPRGSEGFEVLVRTKQMISTQWCCVQAMRWPEMVDEAIKRLAWWDQQDGPAWQTNPGSKHG